MSEKNLKSKCKKIKDIPWTETIFVDKIIFDQNLFNIHKERINKVFANASNEVKEQQLQNILLRDTLFNKAMEIVASCYQFELDQADVDFFIKALKQNIPNNGSPAKEYEDKIKNIAEKLVQKQLIFNDIANAEGISVDSEEMLNVLDDYHKSTGLPIDDIKNDREKLTSAVAALLEEKITAFIINKFPKNLEALYKNMEKDIEEHQKKENANKDK